MRFLALGDSYTIGEAVAESERWPAQLVARLRASGIDVADAAIIARTGWTADELDAAIDAASPRGTYEMVTLLVGVNDQYRGRDAESYRAPFRKLLDRAIGFAGGDASRVVVVSIPDWGVTPFAAGRDLVQITEAIDEFNAVNREEARSAGAHYVDVTPVSRAAATDEGLLAADGLHPSARMYEQWTRAIVPVAEAILRPR
jgi:lysophospholipase L1-like esterase